MSDQKYIPAVIPPGNHKLKINSIELKTRAFKDALVYDIVLNVETEPITGDNFKGLKVDYNDDSKGTYKGQVGRVKYSEWGFKDGETKTHQPVVAIDEMLKALKSLCMEIGQLKWFQDLDDTLPTVQDAVDAINRDQIFKNHYLYFCLASRQYLNKKNYVTDDLFLPRYSKEAGKPFSKKTDDMIVFNSTIHVQKVGAVVVAKTNTKSADTPGKSPDFMG